MESRFAHDFHDVRVHANEEATSLAKSVRAKAFTLGHDIVFAQGQHRPHTTSGRWLLAHELTHTLQQSPDVVRRSLHDPTQSDLVTMTDEEIRSHPTYFDTGITGITYYGEDKEAVIEYEGGESLAIDTSDIRTQSRTRLSPGAVAFGVSPEDLVEPEIPSDYIIDGDSGRVVPVEINIESAPVFTAMLRNARHQFDTGTRKVGEAGVAIYSDWRFQALVLTPYNRLLQPSTPTAKPTPRQKASPAVKGGVPLANRLGGLVDKLNRTGLKPTQQASKMNIAKVEQYAEVMRSGKWKWSDVDKIIIDKNGAIMSGHHRIMAATEAGVTIPESAIHRMSTETIREVTTWALALTP